MIDQIKQQIIQTLQSVGIDQAELAIHPKFRDGRFCISMFSKSKSRGKNPAEVAIEIVEQLNDIFQKEDMKQSSLIREVKAFGPYVNFFLDEKELARFVLSGMGENYGEHDIGSGKQVLIEFGCPNPMKVFHLGHLKNLITGEAVVRTFENAGYDVVRTNYQGDVGMHIAKVLYGLSAQGESASVESRSATYTKLCKI
jgi:arginyl-tRNA synthetase